MMTNEYIYDYMKHLQLFKSNLMGQRGEGVTKSIPHQFRVNIQASYNFNMKLILLLLLLLIFSTIQESQKPYKLLFHNTDHEAKCLDGTSPGIYLHEGGDTSRFVIFFEGGGFCKGFDTETVLQDCYKRTKSHLGSSNYLDKEITVTGGYLSTNPNVSKFATWTKVLIAYCDGGQHQGYVADPISYKDIKLFMRGSVNTRAHFKWLLNSYKLNKASKVLLTGASAGGIATFTWSNYMRRMLDNPENLYTVADSSIYANVSFPNTEIYAWNLIGQNLFKVTNIDEKFPIEACNDKYRGQQWRCVFIQFSYEFLESKIMFINSAYDPVGISNTMNITCFTSGRSGKTLNNCSEVQMKHIEWYHQKYMNDVHVLASVGHSIWTISCCQHSYACFGDFYNVSSQKVPATIGITVAEAIDRFVFQNQIVVMIDKVPWPQNQPCAF